LQRFLVAEVIKNSSISLNKLISIVVADELGQPNWDDMLVPHGEFDLQLKLPTTWFPRFSIATLAQSNVPLDRPR
jgi:hypothetical protein